MATSTHRIVTTVVKFDHDNIQYHGELDKVEKIINSVPTAADKTKLIFKNIVISRSIAKTIEDGHIKLDVFFWKDTGPFSFEQFSHLLKFDNNLSDVELDDWFNRFDTGSKKMIL